MRTKEIELQYYLARFDRDKKATEAELAKMRLLQTQVQSLSRSETQLRTELNRYTDKLGEACNVGVTSLLFAFPANEAYRQKQPLTSETTLSPDSAKRCKTSPKSANV